MCKAKFNTARSYGVWSYYNNSKNFIIAIWSN